MTAAAKNIEKPLTKNDVRGVCPHIARAPRPALTSHERPPVALHTITSTLHRAVRRAHPHPLARVHPGPASLPSISTLRFHAAHATLTPHSNHSSLHAGRPHASRALALLTLATASATYTVHAPPPSSTCTSSPRVGNRPQTSPRLAEPIASTRSSRRRGCQRGTQSTV